MADTAAAALPTDSDHARTEDVKVSVEVCAEENASVCAEENAPVCAEENASERHEDVQTPPSAQYSWRKRSTVAGPTRSLKILVASWNVGNAMPPKNSKLIGQWLPEGGGDFDVIAIGLQESTYREKSTSVGDLANNDPKSPASSVKSDNSDNDDWEDGGADTCEAEEDDAGDTETDKPPSPTPAAAAPNSTEQATEPTKSPTTIPEQQNHINTNNANSLCSPTTNGSTNDQTVVVKRSRTKTSLRKVSTMVKQLSSNLRDTVGDALDYPFMKPLLQHLGDDYELAGKVELMEMRLIVMVHTRNSFSKVEKAAIPTGLGSVIGNKGGLILKCVVENTSLCFASCHLAAHQDQKFLEKRNSDCATILEANVGRKNVSFDYQFDHCFWFGDLNYRVDMNYDTVRDRSHDQHFEEVLALVRARKWSILNRNDQLKHQIELKKALTGWELPPAMFPPTFKRVRHFDQEFNPQRVPSYCDRILHKSLPGLRSNLKMQRFSCVEAISTSDHKPVFAEFHVTPTPIVHVNRALFGTSATTVEFSELVAKDLLGMDLSGLSDPYIKFYSVPDGALQKESNGSRPSTAKILNTLSPAWRDDQVPELRLLCNSEKGVKQIHLVLLLMDYDATSKDDVMGVAVLSLDKFCTGKPRFHPFDIQAVCYGKAAGSISGKVRVTLPSQVEHRESAAEQAITIAKCHCNVS